MDMEDLDFIDIVERVRCMIHEIFKEDKDMSLSEDKFRELWERNIDFLNVSDKTKNHKYGWQSFYHHYLILRKLELIAEAKINKKEEEEKTSAKVTHLRLVKS